MMDNFASFYVPVVLFFFDLFNISIVHVPTNTKKIELYNLIFLLMFL